MKRYATLFLTFAWMLCIQQAYSQHKFTINLNDIADDQFKVTLEPDGLSAENDIFQFAATAPGTYQIMDVGRFVRSFTAFDKGGNTLETEQISTNQWKLSDPVSTAKITYSIAETWDTPVPEHIIHFMAGTSLENDHTLINNQAVLGYFHGLQSHEIWIKLEYPDQWKHGSAMTMNDEGYFTAPDYDFAVDSPILLGRLSTASIDVEGTKIEVYTYSKTDMIQSDSILKDLEDILFAASKFTEGLPVDRYVFLFHFEDLDYGAWEHSYSSEYVFKEAPMDEQRTQTLRSVVAHEFFHVVTPLNIHSELVEEFNFEKPVFSQHLWLYEGVTEWSAWMMQLRNGILSLDDYLKECTKKMMINDTYDSTVSLTYLGENAAELQTQYSNIYMKGAMTATMLDLLLLSESKGKRGLREVMIELTEKYGPSTPFPEDQFFDIFVDMTYPEVEGFINDCIKGTKRLPVKEYFANVGIDYQEFAGYDSTNVSIGIGLTVNSQQKIVITQVNDQESPIMAGDVIDKMNGVEISLANAQQEINKIHSMKPGDEIAFTMIRNGDEVELKAPLKAHRITHQFRIEEDVKKKKMKLRKKWMTNL